MNAGSPTIIMTAAHLNPARFLIRINPNAGELGRVDVGLVASAASAAVQLSPRFDGPGAHVGVPHLQYGDRLLIDLAVLGDSEGTVDVEIWLTHRSGIILGSASRFRIDANGQLARLFLSYRFLGDRVEIVDRAMRLVAREARTRSVEEREAPKRWDVRNVAEQTGEHLFLDVTGWPLYLAEGANDERTTRGAQNGALADGVDGTDPTDRRINLWIAELEAAPGSPLVLGQPYTLCMNVGRTSRAGLVDDGTASIEEGDIPATGLQTQWLIEAYGAELAQRSSDAGVEAGTGPGESSWISRFSLLIPGTGDSDTIQLGITPLATEDVRLRATIHAPDPAHPARAELFREFSIELWVVPARGHDQWTAAAARFVNNQVHAHPGLLNLRSAHEWMTPRGQLSLLVRPAGEVWAQGDPGNLIVDERTEWEVDHTIEPTFVHVRGALEAFRGKYQQYLNLIEPHELEGRLAAHKACDDYRGHGAPPAAEAVEGWNAVERSPELRTLALEGAELCNRFFRPGTRLREWIDALEPGGRLNITSHLSAGSSHVRHVPWGLMYRRSVPPEGAPVDPAGFLGLSLRLGYSAYKTTAASRALGAVDQVTRAFVIYWGNRPPDTASEGRRQVEHWRGSPGCVVVPERDHDRHKDRLLQLLAQPGTPPQRVIYLYCQCNIESGNDFVLRFDDDTREESNLWRREFLGLSFSDRPLVFANACETTSADPYFANELEVGFITRQARGYVGTVSKVPVELASRFARVFFHYFDRQADQAPISAGEALYQTKLFFWRNYRNLGGLFYQLVNDYDIYMADEAELRLLRP